MKLKYLALIIFTIISVIFSLSGCVEEPGGIKAATPTFSPAAGTYTSIQSVTISSTTSGAVIHYTTDGTDPTENSPVYSEPLEVFSTTEIKAIAAQSGLSVSDVGSAKYTFSGWVELFSDDFSSALSSSDWSGSYYGSATNTADVYNGKLTGYGDIENTSDTACSNLVNRSFTQDRLRIEFSFVMNHADGNLHIHLGNSDMFDGYSFHEINYTGKVLEVYRLEDLNTTPVITYIGEAPYAGVATGTEYLLRIELNKTTNQKTVTLYDSAGAVEHASVTTSDSVITDPLTRIGIIFMNDAALTLSDATNPTIDNFKVYCQ